MTTDAIPSKVQAVIDLFAESLAHVSFPGIDHHTFLVLSDAVQAQAAEVEAARMVLEEARQGLDERRRELAEHARLGLAYAEIYARTEPELNASITTLGEALRTPAKRPRGRGRKKGGPADEAEELPLMSEA